MLFGNRHVNDDIQICIDREELEKVSVTKFVGVYIDYRLDWKRHIGHIINKVSKSISIIYKASQKLNETTFLMLYSTLMLPYSSYCSEVWNRTYKTNLNVLFVKQNNFSRIIGKLSRYDHTTPLFLKLNILKLFDLFEYIAACFIYLVYLRKAPEHLQNFYVRNISDYGLRKPYYYKKKKVSSSLKMCMSVYGIDLLQNNLSMVQNSKYLCIYKRKYKDKLLAKYKEYSYLFHIVFISVVY